MRAMTLEVAMLADVRGAYSAISSVNLCVTGPLSAFVTTFGCTWLWLVNKALMARYLKLDGLLWIGS